MYHELTSLHVACMEGACIAQLKVAGEAARAGIC